MSKKVTAPKSTPAGMFSQGMRTDKPLREPAAPKLDGMTSAEISRRLEEIKKALPLQRQVSGQAEEETGARKLVVAVDIDGVLADYSQGWQGPTIIGDPLPGAVQFLTDLRAADYHVMIWTCRDTDVAKAWLTKHGLPYDDINTNSLAGEMGSDTSPKELADIYLDDRGLRFDGDFAKTLNAISDFRTWYDDPNKDTQAMTNAAFQRRLKVMEHAVGIR
jgi:hypothetical protein